MHGELMHDAVLRAFDLDALQLVLGRDLALDQLRHPLLDLADLGSHLAAQILVNLDALQFDLAAATLWAIEALSWPCSPPSRVAFERSDPLE